MSSGYRTRTSCDVLHRNQIIEILEGIYALRSQSALDRTVTREGKQKMVAEFHAKFLDFLFQFEPMQDRKLGDIKCIADFARSYAFDMLPETDD